MKLTRRAALQSAAAAAFTSGCAAKRGKSRSDAASRVVDLRVDYIDRPLGLEAQRPLLSWRMESNARGARQTAYRIQVSRSENLAAAVWDSGRVESAQSFAVPYGGPALRSGERVFWRVQVWNEKARELISAVSWWEMGLTDAHDWSAEWLVAEDAETLAERAVGLHWIWGDTQKDDVPRRFRWRFSVESQPLEALLFISAKDNLVGLWLDGERVLSPQQWLSWGALSRVDLTQKLGPGQHVVALEVGVRTDQARPVVGGAITGYLRLRQASGSVLRLPTGSHWRTVLADDRTDWVATEFDDGAWARSRVARVQPDSHPWPAGPAVLLRREFQISKPLARARLYATALGAYELRLNGRGVGDRRLAPETTDFRSRALYQTYDVTEMLRDGANVMGAMVGDGWYASAFSYLDMRYAFGEPPRRFLAQLELTYTDGSRERVVTDEQWRLAVAPILASEIYDGETYDARREQAGWDSAGFQDHEWAAATVGERPPCRLHAQVSAPIRVRESLRPVARAQNVYDFGQNIAGWARIAVRGAAGATVRLRFAEVLQPSGEIDTANLRRARSTDTYVLRGDAQSEIFEPHFTYHGFRYVEVTLSDPADVTLISIEAVVAHSDLPITGTLRAANPGIEQFWHATLWSQRANFFGVPTDCPQRDERMGWLGDAQIFWDAAAFNMDIAAFTRRFMSDVRAGQAKSGEMPDTAPFWALGQNTPGWADAAAILPWTCWQRYGDVAVIEENWEALDRWQRRLLELNPDHVWRNSRGLDYGDWLAVDAGTPKELVSTAYWFYSASLLAEMAEATDRASDAQRYRDLAGRIRDAFVAGFVAPDGTVGNGSQTSAILALRFGLLPAERREAVVARLAADIARRGNKLSTGFLGTPYILDVLAEHGRTDVAVSLLLQTEYPSWGFMMKSGATTVWERWDGVKDGKVKGSLNHYALGAVVGFLFRRLAGIDTGIIGFRRVRVRPLIDARLGRGGGDYTSVMGRISTDWSREAGGVFRLILRLPANCMGEVHLPATEGARIFEGRRRLGRRGDVTLQRWESGVAVIETGSGEYEFVVEPA
jgi:alpha-L-rhamnosidase